MSSPTEIMWNQVLSRSGKAEMHRVKATRTHEGWCFDARSSWEVSGWFSLQPNESLVKRANLELKAMTS